MKQNKFSLFSGKSIKSGVEVTEVVLDNGLTVYLNEDHNTSEIFGAIGIKVGAKNDPESATGMAHYQEHMLFKGTTQLGTTNWIEEKPFINSIVENFEKLQTAKTKKEQEQIVESINTISVNASKYEISNEFNTVLRKMGAFNINAYTSFESTIYYSSMPSNQLFKWLEVNAHRFTEPVFRSFQAEMEVVLEEKSMSADSENERIMQEYDKRFFKVHPYGQASILGSTQHLQKPSLKKMYEFFNTYYVANNMVLSLSGGFDSQEAIEMVKATFGKLKSAQIPENKQYPEKDFKGREFASVRMSPIRYAMLGFRAPKCGHPDETIFEVLTGILTNENETGLFDKLRIDNKILNADISLYNYQDYGQATIYALPKILSQTLRSAENLVLKEIENLKKGDFPDWLLNAVKYEVYRNYLTTLEHVSNKGLMLAEAFVENRNIQQISKLPSEIMAITKKEIVRVANAYFGKNYLAFYSRVGFPSKKKKTSKKMNAINSNSTEISEFAKTIEEIKVEELNPKFIDFQKDIQRSKIGESTFFYTNNPVNDIFELTIYFGIGTKKMPLLDYAATLMNYAGTEDLNLDELKEEFDKIGCTYNIYTSSSYLTVYLEGIEKNLKKAFKLLAQLLKNPMLDDEQLDILYEDLKAEKKVKGKKPEDVFNALNSFVLNGEKSPYINRYKDKEIKAISSEQFTEIFKEATKYKQEYYYVGETSKNEVQRLITELFLPQKNQKPSDSPVKTEYVTYNEDSVFFTEFSKTNQSRILFFMDIKPRELNEIATINTFNRYFDGGFSGLLMQEIREKRSLAYSTDGSLSVPLRPDERVKFLGSIETQGEKTLEAIEIYLNLLKNMPKEPEKMDMIKSYLINSSLTNTVHFRELAQTIDILEFKGYTEDPAKALLEKYKTITFDEIYDFYEKNIKNKPITIALVGNSKHFDVKKLKKFGKLHKINKNSLYKIKRIDESE